MAITKMIPAVIAVRPRGQRGLPGPPGAPGDQVNFTTRLAAAASNIDEDVDFLRVSGYAVIGDGGGGSCWRRVSGAPTHFAWFQSADGAYWEYCIEQGSIFIPHLGGFGDDTTPCDTAFDAAWSLILQNAGRGTIDFGAGTFRFIARINKIMALGSSMVTIRGDGIRVTEFHFPNESGGLRLFRQNFRCVVNLVDFSITTGQPGVGTAIEIDGSDTVSIPASAWNNISNVYIGGDDWVSGYYLEKYWAIGIHIKVWGQFNFYNVNTIGNSVASNPGNSIGLFLEGNPNGDLYGILYNVNQCSFVSHTFGIIYGDWIQGLTIDQCNFNGSVGSQTAIFAGGSGTGLLAQLTISNSQFDVGGSVIQLLSPVYDISICNNLLTGQGANQAILDITHAVGFTIMGNKFSNPNNDPATGQTGIDIHGTGLGTIVGNHFSSLNIGVSLQAGVSGVTVGLNTYVNTTTKVNNVAGGANSVGTQAVGNMTGVVP